MDRATALVFSGFTRLNAAQQDDLINELNEYIRGNQLTKSSKVEEAYRVVLGPVSGGCPCCGR
ncbi:hypothetical protein Pme01_50950 [Planosporangium mesophilum]|uniref:Uncharacterized protein n=1 Tax=Planosporangium mesophilum TaxID=689768 RepID=A0A8J3TFH3_9ACTN|nr:hypothetical protein Pme01_50950 [Planosporangium mesophilum]